MDQFYSYLWLREDGSPYYAGKGVGGRAFRSSGHAIHCPPSRERILIFSMRSEAKAFESEMALIDLFGRKDLGTGCLRNLTDGGEGASGNIPSIEARKNMARAQTGRKHSQKSKANRSAALKGRTIAWGDKISAAHKKNKYRVGYTHTPETIQRMRAAWTRRKAGGLK